MMTNAELPLIRTLNAIPVSQGVRQLVLLEDPLGISEQPILIPPQVTPLLVLCDGTRNLSEIKSALASMYGLDVTLEEIQRWLEFFNDAALLDNDVFHSKKAQALESYRSAQARPMSLGDEIYPRRKKPLAQKLNSYLEHAQGTDNEGQIIGMICPHIDYDRGWRVYADVMEESRQALLDAELLIVLGTDHVDDGNALTLTQQSYQTPYGVMPTVSKLVERLDQQLTAFDVFRGELRHQHEHSIELALVWLHHMRAGSPCSVLPILCGGHELLFAEDTGRELAWVTVLVANLSEIIQSQKTVVIAAADLAHVGAVFGGHQLPPDQRAEVALADERLLRRVKEVDPQGFIEEITRVQDRNNVCGITPIFLLLRLLSHASGKVVSYELCPADQSNTSWVSICGAIFK